MFESIAPPITLSDDRRQEIIGMVRDDIMSVDSSRERWLEGVEAWRKSAVESDLGPRDLPWDGAADHRHDMIPDEVDDFVARGMNILFGDQFWAPAKPTTEAAADVWNKIENFMQWGLEADIKFWTKASDIIRATCTDGVSFVYSYWHKSIRKTRRLSDVAVTSNATGQAQRMSPQQVARSVVSDDELDSFSASDDHYVAAMKDGTERRIWVQTYSPDDTHTKVEVEEHRTCKNRPEVRVLDPKRVWVPNIGTLEDVPFCTIEFDVTLDWLKQQRKMGAFNVLRDEDWEKLESDHMGTNPRGEAQDSGQKKPSTDTWKNQYDDSVDDSIGTDRRTDQTKSRPVRIAFYQYDIDQDGDVEDIMFMIDPRTDSVLAADYLDRRVDYDGIPIAMFQFIRIEGRTYVPGLPYYLLNTAVLINTLINQSIDAQTVANLGGGAYDVNMAPDLADRGVLQKRPMEYVPVDGNPREVFDHQNFSAPEFDKLMPFIGMLEQFGRNRSGGGGFSPNGRAGQNGLTPRTYGGTQIQLLESQIRQAYLYRALADGFQSLYDIIFVLYAEFMPPSMKFRVSGKDGFEFLEISKEDLRDRPDFIFAINTLSGNPAVRQASALLLFQTVGPFLAQRGAQPQMDELLERFLRAYDEPKPEALIPSPFQGMDHPPMTQQEEDELLFQGKPLGVNPIDNDLEHLQVMQQTDQVHAQMGIMWQPDQLMERERHRFAHIQQLEQKTNAGPGSLQDEGGRPMGGERRAPGQPRQNRPPGGGTFN